MHAEPLTVEVPKLQLPADLINELTRRGPNAQADLRVEGWKPSLFGRFVEKLVGKG